MSRVSLKSMAIPTMAEVHAAGDKPFAAHVWEKTPFPAPTVSGDFPAVVRRCDVFAAYERSIEEGIVWTIVWGYPRGTITGWRDGILYLFENAKTKAEIVRKFQTEPGSHTAAQINSAIGEHAPHIACSTTSKIAYFARLVATEGPCVVYDRKVVSSIMQGKYTEFSALEDELVSKKASAGLSSAQRTSSALSRQQKTFGAYLASMKAVSNGIGVSEEQLEYYIFSDI